MSHFTRIERTPATGSTNEDVARILGEEQARGLVVVAAYQERGAGRRGRAWIAPPNTALLCTMALPEPLAAGSLWSVPFWAALVTHRALQTLGVATTLQWPNDVLVTDGRKISGILCISRVSGNDAWAACGIGINVIDPGNRDSYAALESPPAFVNEFTPVGIEETLHALIEAADGNYDLLRSPARIISDWEAGARVPGARYRILRDGEAQPFDATALRLLSDGSLLVDRGGDPVTVTLADARVLR